MCDTDYLKNKILDIPKELQDTDDYKLNVWICNGKLIRMVLNPFKPAKIPYMAAPMNLTHIHSFLV